VGWPLNTVRAKGRRNITGPRKTVTPGKIRNGNQSSGGDVFKKKSTLNEARDKTKTKSRKTILELQKKNSPRGGKQQKRGNVVNHRTDRVTEERIGPIKYV